MVLAGGGVFVGGNKTPPAALKPPESPRYLVATGREREAAIVLGRILKDDIPAKIAEIRPTVDRAFFIKETKGIELQQM
jgi:hypothetical protein